MVHGAGRPQRDLGPHAQARVGRPQILRDGLGDTRGRDGVGVGSQREPGARGREPGVDNRPAHQRLGGDDHVRAHQPRVVAQVVSAGAGAAGA